MAKLKNSTNRYDLLEWEAHLLCGVAGNIGAMEVCRLAQQLESMAKTGGDAVESILNQLQKEYARVSASILTVIQQEKNKRNDTLADEECMGVMQELMQMMQKGDPEALRYFSETGAVIKREVGEEIYKKLVYHIERYEFDEALGIMMIWEKTNEG